MASKAPAGPTSESEAKAPPVKRGRGRPPIPPEVARARLVDAAERCFERESYFKVGVLDIVSEAQMSSRSFYQHFDAKIDVVLAITEARAEAYIQKLERAADEATTILEGVELALTGFLEDLPLVVLELRGAGGPDGERMRELLDRYRPRMGATFLKEFARAMQEGLVETIPDPMSVLIVVYGIESLVTQSLRGPNRREAMLALKPQILAATRKLFPEWL
ncbi:MAG: TetR/AcrR family transcriptional regulator [Deltaproteobacteria bacterium]|nr:TetR/AcrR family transcriptional regulator [Deltaproteobacteria bacterium]MBW2444498.1 TetR/AcrR family transcriptional regulator [Deltaproteobacteria bacterium]